MRSYIPNDEYATGYAEIDAQHRQVFTMLRELQLELYDNPRPQMVQKKLQEMQDYAEKHFKDEEKILLQYKDCIPCYEKHLAEHQGFIDSTNAFKKRLEVEGFDIAHEVLIFLTQWFKEHILRMDKASFEIINKQ